MVGGVRRERKGSSSLTRSLRKHVPFGDREIKTSYTSKFHPPKEYPQVSSTASERPPFPSFHLLHLPPQSPKLPHSFRRTQLHDLSPLSSFTFTTIRVSSSNNRPIVPLLQLQSPSNLIPLPSRVGTGHVAVDGAGDLHCNDLRKSGRREQKFGRF